MRNNKGFTLMELLAVIVILGLISTIAIPNIIGLSTGIKKDQMLDDAKKLISLAKYKINSNISLRGSSQTFYISDLNFNGDIGKDPDGGDYNSNSRVEYKINDSNKISYCIVLLGSKRSIGSDTNCIIEEELYARSNVVDNTPAPEAP